MTVKNKFNRGGVIKSEASSVEERNAKIAEMEARGFSVKRLYSYETGFLDRVASGYSKVPVRNVGLHLSKKYGVVFEKAGSSVEG